MSIKRSEQNTLLNLLRNPDDWTNQMVNEARVKAANELERLWSFESGIQMLADDMDAQLRRIEESRAVDKLSKG